MPRLARHAAGDGAREADPGEGGARGCARGGRQPAQRRARMVGARRRPARIRERPGGGAARGWKRVRRGEGKGSLRKMALGLHKGRAWKRALVGDWGRY